MLRTAWRFRRFLRPHLASFSAGGLLVIAGTLLELAQPWPLKVIVDGVIGGHEQHSWFAALIAGDGTSVQLRLLRALVATVVLVALSAGCDWFSDLLLNGSGQRVVATVRAALFGHLQRLSLSFHHDQRVGDLVGRLTVDIDRTQNMLTQIFDTLVPNAVMLLGLTVAMLVIDPSFGLLALSIAPPLFLLTYRHTLRIRRASRRAREAGAGLAAMANETLASIRAVQAFSREDGEQDRFARHNDESLLAGLQAIRLKASLTPMVELVSLAGTVIVTYAGVQRVLEGRMSLGVLLVFLTYLRSLYKPMRALSKMAYVVSQGVASAERVDEILSTQRWIPQLRHPKPVTRLSGRIEFQHVSFSYQADGDRVLDRASLLVQPGEHIGIVGRTGAGKSTLISLIPRFYDPEGGRVLVDGQDVRELHLPSLRRQVGLVLQEPVLFYGTILDNIRYGNPAAPIERVWQVAAMAHVTEFLERLPEGILTRIGERGANLSGGQRQRIAIARTMLLDAPILILDEPTNGLDLASEAFVLDSLQTLARNRTVFVISHHPGALIGLDRIVEVRDRKLVPGRAPVHATAPDRQGAGR